MTLMSSFVFKGFFMYIVNMHDSSFSFFYEFETSYLRIFGANTSFLIDEYHCIFAGDLYFTKISFDKQFFHFKGIWIITMVRCAAVCVSRRTRMDNDIYNMPYCFLGNRGYK